MFEGRQVFSGEVPTPSVEKPFKVDLTFGPNPLPPGSGEPEISGPASVSADFRGGGPRGPFLYPAACDSTRAVKMNNITPCAKDESAQPLTGVASASCSAVLTGVENREVRVEINFAGTFQAGPSRSSGYSTFGSGRPTGPVVEVDTAITAKEMTLRSGNLPPGPYVCRWLVDGNEVGTRTFTVKVAGVARAHNSQPARFSAARATRWLVRVGALHEEGSGHPEQAQHHPADGREGTNRAGTQDGEGPDRNAESHGEQDEDA